MSAVDMPAAPIRERRVVPVVALVGVVLLVLFGGYLVAAALSEPAGPPVTIAGVVRVSPLSGWELAQRFSRSPAVGARLTRGAGTLDVVAMIPPDASSRDLVGFYVDRFLDPDSIQLSISNVHRTTLRSGLRAARISYVGTFGDRNAPIEGQLTAVVAPSGAGVVFDGWAPRGLLQYALDDIERMVALARVS